MDDNKLRDLLYRHALASNQMGRGLANELVRLLNQGDAELTDKIAARYAKIEAKGFDSGPQTTKDLEDMLQAVREVNTRVYKPVADAARENLYDIAQHEMEFTRKAVASAGGSVSTGATLPDFKSLKSLVENTPIPVSDQGASLLGPWLKSLDEGRISRLETAIRSGSLQGETTAQLMKRVQEHLLGISRQSAQTFALTANSAIQNRARLETFKDMKSVQYVEWSSFLDSRTTPTCMSLSGQVWPINAPHPNPPRHPRCRSILLPRRDNNGAKHQPFGEWLAEQDEASQNEILGKDRADLFRKNPDFNFQGFFRADGRFRTLQQLRDFDARLFGEGGVKSAPKPQTAPEPKATPKAPEKAPEPAPEAKQRLTSAIDPAVNENTIDVAPRKQLVKELGAKLAENAKALAYDPVPEFRGVKAEMFGKAALGAEFTDQAASAIAALMPELDKIADAFAIPRLRAIRGISATGSTIGNMGDGLLGLNPTYFNAFASKVGVAEAGAESTALLKLKAERDAVKVQQDALYKQLGNIRTEIEALARDPAQREAYMTRRIDYNDLVKKFNALRTKSKALDSKIWKVSKNGDRQASTWKVGDDLKDRPYTVDQYFTGLDQMRAVMFHEQGHHVHQSVGKVGRRYVNRLANLPPVEKRIAKMFFEKFHGAAPGNIGGRGIERKALLTSTYATENEKEWFAESFSAYMMGRKDLADPDLVKLIEELLDGAA